MKTIRLTMAQALLRFLDAQYVELDGVEHIQALRVDFAFGERAVAHGLVAGDGVARIRMVQILSLIHI